MNWDEVIFDSIKDKRFWILLLFLMIFIALIRMKSTPIPLPEAAHNTIGDNPLLEQADDGYISPIEGKPKYVSENPTTMDLICSNGCFSVDIIHFS